MMKKPMRRRDWLGLTVALLCVALGGHAQVSTNSIYLVPTGNADALGIYPQGGDIYRAVLRQPTDSSTMEIVVVDISAATGTIVNATKLTPAPGVDLLDFFRLDDGTWLLSGWITSRLGRPGFMMRLSADMGTILWQKIYQVPSDTSYPTLGALSGRTVKVSAREIVVLQTAGVAGAWVARIDLSTGNVLACYRIHGLEEGNILTTWDGSCVTVRWYQDYGRNLVVDRVGSGPGAENRAIILGGITRTQQVMLACTNTEVDRDWLVLSLSLANGQIRWAKVLDSNYYERYAHGIFRVFDGESSYQYWVIGRALGAPYWGQVMKLSQAGNVIENTLFGSIGNSALEMLYPASSIRTTDGGWLLTGYSSSYTREYIDGILLKTDSQLRPQWMRRHNIHGVDHRGEAVAETQNYYVVAQRPGVALSSFENRRHLNLWHEPKVFATESLCWIEPFNVNSASNTPRTLDVTAAFSTEPMALTAEDVTEPLFSWNTASISAVPACCPAADVTGDCCVDDADLLAVLFAFGTTGVSPADINEDFVVDDADLLLVLFQFGTCG